MDVVQNPNRRIFLKGFNITPVVMCGDLDTDELEEIQLGTSEVSIKGIQEFFEGQWPQMWLSLKAQFAADPNPPTPDVPPTPPNRAQRRAKPTGRTTPKQVKPKLMTLKDIRKAESGA